MMTSLGSKTKVLNYKPLLLLLLFLMVSINPLYSLKYSGHPHQITCYTCPNSTTNSQCNKVAPDEPCDIRYQYCLTKHVLYSSINFELLLNTHNKTESVIKLCADLTTCENDSGCSTTIDYRTNKSTKICGSCCKSSYCNQDIPWSTTDAIITNSSTQKLISSALLPIMSLLWLLSVHK